MQQKSVRKAVIPVAGLGTRFLPITKAIPKEMLPIIDRPAVHLIVEEALDSGIEQIVFVTGRQKNAIEDYFDHNFELNEVLRRRNRDDDVEMLEGIATRGSYSFIRQTQPMGLGHAVLCAQPIIGDEPFALLLGDDLIFTRSDSAPALKQLIDAFEQSHLSQVALMKVPQEELHRYGVADGNMDKSDDCVFDITHLEEKPAKGSERGSHGIVGRYILTPEIWPILKSMAPQDGEEIQITPALDLLREREGLKGYKFKGTRIDAGDRLGYLKANIYSAMHREDLAEGTRRMLSEFIER